MSGHQSATLKRVQNEPVVLVPQDTTFLNFATDDKSKRMGTLRMKKSNQQLLHASIAITPSRVNLGVVDGSLWQREDKNKTSKNSKKLVEGDKESQRWLSHYESACDLQAQSPDTTVVSIADREGDIHEWFQRAEEVPVERRASYIIRAKANRALYVDEERTSLWEHMNSLKSLGAYFVDIPKRNGELGRTANVEVYSAEVELTGRGKARRSLYLHAVYVKESQPPVGEKGVEWMLLTDLPVEDVCGAKMIIDWYRCRWEIEMYFRVLKGSCDIEKNRFRSESRMFNCIAIYMIISWRLHCITMESRRSPEMPCTEIYSDKEWKVLYRVVHKGPPPKEPPTVKKMTRLLATLY